MPQAPPPGHSAPSPVGQVLQAFMHLLTHADAAQAFTDMSAGGGGNPTGPHQVPAMSAWKELPPAAAPSPVGAMHAGPPPPMAGPPPSAAPPSPKKGAPPPRKKGAFGGGKQMGNVGKPPPKPGF
jgi:hypothetical protein